MNSTDPDDLPEVHAFQLLGMPALLQISMPSKSERQKVIDLIESRPIPYRGRQRRPRPRVYSEYDSVQAAAQTPQDLSRLNDKIDHLLEIIDTRVPMSDHLWSYKQVAKKCDAADSTVRSWVTYGQVETVIGPDGKRRIPDKELRLLLKNAGKPVRPRIK